MKTQNPYLKSICNSCNAPTRSETFWLKIIATRSGIICKIFSIFTVMLLWIGLMYRNSASADVKIPWRSGQLQGAACYQARSYQGMFTQKLFLPWVQQVEFILATEFLIFGASKRCLKVTLKYLQTNHQLI